MKTVDLDKKKDKGFVEIAEIIPPLEEQWFILSPSTNLGWITLKLPETQLLSLPLRPGAIYIVAPSYQGKILACLGVSGLPTPEKATIVFVNNYEYEEAFKLHIDNNI